jgi:cephalosporin hydroxylase
MNQHELFQKEVKLNIAEMATDKDLQALSRIWIREIAHYKYAYNFSWMGRPIIQFPTDMIALQELIFSIKPDLIIETGIAHGGSLIYSASLLELLGGDGYVLGIDIDIRPHNKAEIEKHPMAKRIKMIQGSSIDSDIIAQAKTHVAGKKSVMVILDSNHTHDHVLQELQGYSPFVTKDSYLIVYDTLVEDMPSRLVGNRPWGPGNNPKTAVWEFLKSNSRFEIDKEIENKLLITVAPDGWLKCIA